MRAHRVLGSSAYASVALALLTAGCSASGTDVGDPDPQGAGGAKGAGGNGGSVSAGGASAAGGGLNVTGNCQGMHCSSDLHSYVDCDGNVIMECPPDQGCSMGTCVGACDAAKQNQTSFGCDYYVVAPDVILGARGGCFAAFVVNTWNADVSFTVDFAGVSLDASKFAYLPTGSGASTAFAPLPNGVIPAGEVAILFLNRSGGSPPGLNTNCPPGIVPATTKFDAATHDTAMGAAFHITTSAPTISYDIYPFGGGRSALTSATLLLPTTAWGDNYIAVSAFGNGGPIGAQPFLSIVGQEDATMVTLNPTVNVKGSNTVAPATKGQPTTYMVNKGQVLQFTQGLSLEGSVIQSSAPIGVWGGMTALGIEACCDESAHQQIPPIRAFGSEYVGVRYRNRYDGMEESPPWRMVGAVDGTQLAWDPSPPPGAPTVLNQGQVAQFDAAGPFVVRAQDADHPFYVSAHMTGAAMYDPMELDPNMSAPADGRGDAEFVNVIPPGEYLDKYVFYSDPTYPETNLVLIRRKGSKGFADVTLDCAGVLDGWAPVGMSGEFEYTRVDLVRHDFQPQGNCDNGRHEISSAQPFGLTVWGWGSGETGQMLTGYYSQYVSYAYPAGAGVAPINKVVVMADPH